MNAKIFSMTVYLGGWLLFGAFISADVAHASGFSRGSIASSGSFSSPASSGYTTMGGRALQSGATAAQQMEATRRSGVRTQYDMKTTQQSLDQQSQLSRQYQQESGGSPQVVDVPVKQSAPPEVRRDAPAEGQRQQEWEQYFQGQQDYQKATDAVQADWDRHSQQQRQMQQNYISEYDDYRY